MIAGFMETLNGIIPRKKTIRPHIKFLIANLHGKIRTQVYNISIPDVWELRI